MQTQSAVTQREPRSRAIQVIPFEAPLGAEVRCADVRTLDESAVQAIRAAYAEHLVLLFRGQELSPRELIEFSRGFGPLVLPTEAKHMTPGQAARDDQFPELAVISNVIENGKAIGALGAGEVVWHSDFSYREEPLSAAVLYAREVPGAGGNTGFSNMYLALEQMPASLRAAIQGKTVKVDATHSGDGKLRGGYPEVTDVRVSKGVSHPLVRTHPETGLNALYLGRRPFAYVNGLSVADSEALLDELWAHADQPRYNWHHEWQPHDILVWDNRCTMHRRDPFDPSERRVMHHVNVAGTKPYCDPNVPADARHPRAYR